MLLKALYDYAIDQRLLGDMPLEPRTVHALIPLDAEGRLQLPYLVPLSTPGRQGKEMPGREFKLPRFPGENNGGKAYFLAEGSVAIFGREKKSGDPIGAPEPETKYKNPTKAFQHFWHQIQTAYEATNDSRLAAILGFKRQYLIERDGIVRCDLPLLCSRPKGKSKNGNAELEFVASTSADGSSFIAVEKSTFGFSVAGVPVTLDDECDPLRGYWFECYAKQAFADDQKETGDTEAPGHGGETLCLVTGRTGEPIARSHKPRIKGVPGIVLGGYLVSFARAASAFSSYGFEMGLNSPVSENAAAAYSLALIELLRGEDTHYNLGETAVCFWAKGVRQASGQFNRLLNKAYPEQVAKFLKSPFAGEVGPDVLNRDRLYTVALVGNAGRVVVKKWLDQTLAEAVDHFRSWWDDLRIASMFSAGARASSQKNAKQGDEPPSPFSIPSLARVTLRHSKGAKDDKLVGERIIQLYSAALEGTPPPITLLKPILEEFHSALVKKNPKNDPFHRSRIILIKLILLRSFRNLPDKKDGDFMPEPQLTDTPDPAYNLGRLLAVLESLQDKYHNYEKKGAGVVERYYGTASSAPAAVFPLLCRLARHHLSKVRREDESAANRLDQQIGGILKKFRPEGPDAAPKFKRMLSLPEQGVFAIGFYQQRAYDRACGSVLSSLGKARELREKKQPYEEPLCKARELADEHGYSDLIAAVRNFEQ